MLKPGSMPDVRMVLPDDDGHSPMLASPTKPLKSAFKRSQSMTSCNTADRHVPTNKVRWGAPATAIRVRYFSPDEPTFLVNENCLQRSLLKFMRNLSVGDVKSIMDRADIVMKDIDLDYPILKGSVLVKNRAFEKNVTVHLSADYWHSFIDIPCEYKGKYNCLDHDVDVFGFEHNIAHIFRPKGRISFCTNVSYNKEAPIWDNNRGGNYHCEMAESIKPDAQHPAARPTCTSDDLALTSARSSTTIATEQRLHQFPLVLKEQTARSQGVTVDENREDDESNEDTDDDSDGDNGDEGGIVFSASGARAHPRNTLSPVPSLGNSRLCMDMTDGKLSLSYDTPSSSLSTRDRPVSSSAASTAVSSPPSSVSSLLSSSLSATSSVTTSNVGATSTWDKYNPFYNILSFLRNDAPLPQTVTGAQLTASASSGAVTIPIPSSSNASASTSLSDFSLASSPQITC